ncbi:DUF4141 domain-containing protein [Stenotrophomonas maltophilia]|uniref:DUF4141 domain-containing protein n=1 Tax=Stenotrophomonas maltophilia TaxID=40324 RepID=UPI003D7E65EE
MTHFPKRNAKRISALVLACTVLMPSPRAAAGMPVIDPTNIAANIANGVKQAVDFGKTAAHHGKQAATWAVEKADRLAQLRQLQQDLVTLSANPMLAMVQLDDKFTRRSPLHGAVAACATNGSFDPQMIWQDFAAKLSGDFKKQQAELCMRMVVAENAKYNATVGLLQQLREFESSLASIEKRRKVRGNAPGNTSALDNDLTAFASNLQLDLDGWNATMAAYDSYIAQLRTEQNRLSKVALRGQPNFFGEIIRPIALKTALETL